MKFLLSFLFGIFIGVFACLNVGFAYSDVASGSDNFDAINYITELKVVKGYDDETFRPNATISRAEFMKIIVLAKVGSDFKFDAADCFKDVLKDQWFSPYVCYAKNEKIVSGYSDGTFKPANPISIVEAAKMLYGVFGDGKTLKEGKYWYSSFIDYMADKKYIPSSIHYTNHEITRGEMAEMIWRMKKEITDLPSVSAASLEEKFCYKLDANIPNDIDMEKVRMTWLSWYNDVRKAEGLDSYFYNDQLNRTATIWSEYGKARGYLNHKRDGQTAYYDYSKIESWFKDLGLEFKNVDRVTFTENINWGYYKCPNGDCTQGLIDAIKGGFDFFMSEKGKQNAAHYKSIVNKNFKEIGLGIAIDPTSKRYYLTVHYATSITSNPPEICVE